MTWVAYPPDRRVPRVRGLRQSSSSPFRQTAHSPQPIQGYATTLSPTLTHDACGPSATTSPATSCPIVNGRCTPRDSSEICRSPPKSKYPSQIWTSLWQTPAASTRSNTSSRFGSGSGYSLASSSFPHSMICIARMVRSSGSQSLLPPLQHSRRDGMEAYHIDRFGSVDGIVLRSSEDPQPGPKEVLMRVRASSLNYRDLMVLKGGGRGPTKIGVVPLSDGVGEVAAIGERVTRIKIGDRIAGCFHPRWFGGPINPEYLTDRLGANLDGMLAQYAVLNEEALVHLPSHLSFEFTLRRGDRL